MQAAILLQAPINLSRPENLVFRDTFLPFFNGKHLEVKVQAVEA